MNMVPIDRGVKNYLEKDKSAIDVSHRLHAPEFELFCELANLCERLGSLCRMTSQEAARLPSPAKLFQVVMCQIYGVASQLLLRRRILDADALTGRGRGSRRCWEIVLHPSADGVERFLTAELLGDYAGMVRLTMLNNRGGGYRYLSL